MSFFESIFYMAWRGIAIGLIISAPMGPVGMLCIQRTLDKGRRTGLYTGIGAAISDLFYCLLTGFGLSFIEDFLERNQNIIQLIGSFVLIGFGVYLFRNNPSKGLKRPVNENVSIEKNILTGFLFTVSNPLILFLIIGLFARFNFILPAYSDGAWAIHLAQYVIGFVFIFIGAIIWWWFITFSVDKVRSHFNIRSMWLINKIIGGIIILFAIVGIFTAVSALANATDIRCWNTSKGYAPFCTEDGSGRLINSSSDTLFFKTGAGGADILEFRCKVRNHHPTDSRKGWGLVIDGSSTKGGNDRISIHFRSTEAPDDGFSTQQALELEIRNPFQPSKKSFTNTTNLLQQIKHGMSGPDPSGSLNFYKVSIQSITGALNISGGLHTPESLAESALPDGFRVDSIGFFIAPGAEISVDEIRLSTHVTDSYLSSGSDPASLASHLEETTDWIEGYWQVLDRSLDETLLRQGGDYRFAMVRAEDGYDLIYLSGARVNEASWKPGMLKATFRKSGIEGIWDVVWHDAMHQPLSHDIKAQIDASGSLCIQFPYHSSTLRLHQSVTPAAVSGR